MFAGNATTVHVAHGGQRGLIPGISNIPIKMIPPNAPFHAVFKTGSTFLVRAHRASGEGPQVSHFKPKKQEIELGKVDFLDFCFFNAALVRSLTC